MISLFKNNNPVALLALLLVAALPFLSPEMHAPTRESLLSMAVLFTEALLINKIIADYKLLERPGLVPALSFLLLHALLPKTITGLNLAVNLLVILVLRVLISVYKKEKPNNSLLLAGLLIGAATLMHTQFVVFYIWLCAGVLIMRPASIREWILTTAGFIIPFYFMASWLYLTDQFAWGRLFVQPNLRLTVPAINAWDFSRVLAFTLLPLLGVVLGNKSISKMMILNRKAHILLLIHFSIAALVCIGELEAFPDNLHTMLLSASVMLSTLFLSFKRDLIPNLVFWSMIAAALIR